MNLPEKFEARMRTMLADEYEAFRASLDNAPAYTGVRVNTLRRGAVDEFLRVFGSHERVEWCENGFYADKSEISGNHPLHLAGVLYFQEPSAMCAAQGLPINEGDKVLDLCAAPGGKTGQLGEKLHNTGILVANEITRGRASVLSGNVERLGLTNTIVTNESPENLAKKYPEYFDKILVDAPCSGEGMFRKEEKALTEWSLEHTLSCAVRQKKILSSAMDMLKPNGLLMYSTCTFAPQEDEEIAEWLIQNGMEILRIPQLSMLSSGISDNGTSETEIAYARRIFPHRHKGEGHFAALFRKTDTVIGSAYKKNSLKAKARRNTDEKAAKELYREFEEEFLNVKLSEKTNGEIVLFGETLCLKPRGADTDGLRLLRCGLELGKARKGRFEPSHALALALEPNDIRKSIHFSLNDKALKKYLAGETAETSVKGWCAVCADNRVLGWGKGSGGILKNHYPKGLRRIIK